MENQRVITYSETPCYAMLPVVLYNTTIYGQAVVELNMRKDSEFVTNRCSLTFMTAVDTVISVVLLAMSCSVEGRIHVMDFFNRRVSWLSCVRYINPGVDWVSEGNMAMIQLEIYGHGLFSARMNAMAVMKPESGTIHTRYVTPTLGFIQNVGIVLTDLASSWDNPVETNAWSHLTVPGNNVVMISVPIAGFGSLPKEKVCQHRLELYEGGMNRTVWRLCSRYRSLPQPHFSYEGEVHVHFVTDVHDDEFMRGIGFRLIYTFHDESSIPVNLANGQWNCSSPTWLTFQQHFICDLTIHCAGGEDERDCLAYTHCGQSGVLRNGKCYSLEKLNPGATWHQANAVCSSLGSGGRLVPSYTDILIFSIRRLRHDLAVYSGHVLLTGIATARVESHL